MRTFQVIPCASEGMVQLERHRLVDKASVSGIRKMVRAALAGSGWTPSASFDCLVAVTEACTNALLHGKSRQHDEPDPLVSWEIDEVSARFYVQNFSTQMWSKAAHPSAGFSSLSQRSAGGFGLSLMKDLMDEVEIDVGPQGTKVSMVKWCGDEAEVKPSGVPQL